MESWEALGVKVARVDGMSLIESVEASFRRERFLDMIPLKKPREPFGLVIDTSSLVTEWVSLGLERREVEDGRAIGRSPTSLVRAKERKGSKGRLG